MQNNLWMSLLTVLCLAGCQSGQTTDTQQPSAANPVVPKRLAASWTCKPVQMAHLSAAIPPKTARFGRVLLRVGISQ